LVADNQYAALGLMLLATLARVRRLILPLRGAVEEEHDGKPYEVAMEGIEQRGLDLGEVIQRGEIQAEQDADDIGSEVKKPKGKKRENKEEGDGRSQAPVDARPTKRPKKKRKKGDAFDDIFDSLI
jgi:ribonuclease MRP protein subunit RMP1